MVCTILIRGLISFGLKTKQIENMKEDLTSSVWFKQGYFKPKNFHNTN